MEGKMNARMYLKCVFKLDVLTSKSAVFILKGQFKGLAKSLFDAIGLM